jgi:hypothetical protein
MLSALVSEEAQWRIRNFVDEVFLPRAVLLHPGVPTNMIDGPPNSSGWIPWKPILSPVSDAEILDLEAVAGAPFPPLFRGWLMYKCLLMTDFGLLRLPETPSDDPLREIRRLIGIMDSQPCFRPRRVIPFGHDGNDTGPLCFDLNRPLPDGDYPIILYDHELLGDLDYPGELFAESFAALLDLLEADMRSYDQHPEN